METTEAIAITLVAIIFLLLIVVSILREIRSSIDRLFSETVYRLALAVKLAVKPGDVVVFRFPGKLSEAEVQHTNDVMRRMLPFGVNFAVLNSDVDITVLSSDE